MACKGCAARKQWLIDKLKRKQTEKEAQNMTNTNPTLFITCYCGIARLLPENTKGVEGEKVTLAACPRCGAGFSGIYKDGKIEVEG